MPIHPDVAERFTFLEGLGSLAEAYGSEAGLEQVRRFEGWDASPSLPAARTRDTSAPGPHGHVPVRVYGSPTSDDSRPCLVWFHGGGFVGGDLDMREADWTAREICQRADAVVVSVDYRLAVDGVHYPVPHDDALAAVAWVRDHAPELGVDPNRICVGGASAGANLSVGAVLKLRDREGWLPAAMLLAYPTMHAATPSPSTSLSTALKELPTALQPPSAGTDWLSENYLGAALSAADGYAFPAQAIHDDLCPTLVTNAEYDHLRASGEAFVAALALASVDVTQVLVRGLLHGFLNQPSSLGPVSRVLDLMARFVIDTSHPERKLP